MNGKIGTPPPCLFKLSKRGGCVGTVHDKCKNCDKRADFILKAIKNLK